MGASVARSVIGLDIGGANLKAAHSGGTVRTQPFALWRDPAGLPEALRRLLADMPTADELAVTMTGELCDCYESKRQGVNAILDAVASVAEDRLVRVWQTSGRLVDVARARAAALETAAANWHALATFVGRFVPSGSALLIDVGSTTTDIIPLRDGRPVPRGWTDPERLRHRELVYTGIRRTPLCALLGASVAAEVFATTLDVYLWTGMIAEDANDRDTADGRPATRAAAEVRLARMLCADRETISAEELKRLILRVLSCQTNLIHEAMRSVAAKLLQPPRAVILSGSGEMLARMALSNPDAPEERLPVETTISLSEQLGTAVTQAACAYAVALLAHERSQNS
jgi:probable H4MPT-linked C1 transfer pathway protein